MPTICRALYRGLACSDAQERKDVCPQGLYLVLEEVNNRSIIYYINKIMNWVMVRGIKEIHKVDGQEKPL